MATVIGLGTVCLTDAVTAEHGSPQLAFLQEQQMPLNGRLLLFSGNGVHTALGKIVQGKKDAHAFLRSASGTEIRLRPVQVFDDFEGHWLNPPRPAFEPDTGYGRAFAVLAPKRQLKPNTQYELVFRFTSMNELTPNKQVSWQPGWKFTTLNSRDTQAPVWREKPYQRFERLEMSGKELSHAIDGPVIVAPLDDAKQTAYFRVDIRPSSGGVSRTLLLPLLQTDRYFGGNQIQSERCAVQESWGNESLDGRFFSLRLAAVDAAGNEASAPGAPLIFEWVHPSGIRICARTK